MRILLVKRRSDIFAVIVTVKMEDQHRQGKREDLASVDVSWWGNHVCQPEGQVASEVSEDEE